MMHLKESKQDSLKNFKRVNVDDWDNIKERITYKLINKKLLNVIDNSEDILYSDCMDLIKVPMISEISSDRKKLFTYILKKEDIEKYNTSYDEIMEIANKNTYNSINRRIKTLTEEVMSRDTMSPIMTRNKNSVIATNEDANAIIMDHDEENDNVLIVSNRDHMYGASYMLDFNTLDIVYDRLGSNFYIIPLSVHEIMCVSSSFLYKVNESKDIYEIEDDLLDMLFELNSKNKNDDVLTYQIYEYFGSDGRSIMPIKKRL